MKESPMSDAFHDWLDQCPVMWIRDRVEKAHVFYAFETPEEDDDEKSESRGESEFDVYAVAVEAAEQALQEAE